MTPRLNYALLLACLATPLRAAAGSTNDDLLVYSEYADVFYGTRTYNNGWQDNGWVPLYNTNNPTHGGIKALCLAPNGGWQAIKFVHGDIDTSIYTNLTLWINGGPTGGQTVGISGLLDGAEQPRQGIAKLPTNAWMQVTLPLTALGVANKTNFDGLEIWSNTGSTQPPFYVDDITLVAKPPPALVRVSINATQTVRTVDARLFGVNTAAWDGNLNSASTISVLTDLDNQVLRWPGGSWGDGYHWTNEYRGWGSYSSDFIKVATNTHAHAYIIVNYGSSSPEEAAYGVRMFNVTNKCGFKYWEVGNECGGSWETDYNTNAPWKPHDPWTYAMRFTNYYAKMKAADPTIKIGAVADTTEGATANYTDHPVVNPRTGQTWNGWTPVMLTYLRSNGVTPDFLIEHKYAPNNGDLQNLLWTKTWASDAASLRQMLTDYLGPAGTNVELAVTEHGAGGDRQRVGLVGGLFWTDSLGQILQTEFNSLLWWDLRNGQAGITNSDNALYGWRTGWFTNIFQLTNTTQFYYDEGIVTGTAAPTNRYPTFYCAKLLKYFARGGDTVVRATNDHPLLATYAVRRTNASLTLLVVNKSASAALTGTISVAGYQPASSAVAYSYGIPQDEAARTGIGSLDVATSSFTGAGTNFTLAFPPYSATVLALAPLTRLVALRPTQQPPGMFVLQIQGQPGARYSIQASTNLSVWASVSTNTLTSETLTVTNPASAGRQFYRATWLP